MFFLFFKKIIIFALDFESKLKSIVKLMEMDRDSHFAK